MIIEIVAGRTLAPSIGISLYTWTSIIGVVLAGISAGNYLGGRLADRFPSPTTLGLIMLAGAVASLSVLPLVNVVPQALDAVPILLRIVLLTTLLFFTPSVILSMVTPVVIKLQLQDLAHTGNVVGKIYAVSTFGSILGTFLTGFVLIQWMGTRPILLLVGLVLVLMALVFGRLWQALVPGMALLIVFVGLGSYSYSSGNLKSSCLRESNYYCIVVEETREEEGHLVRVLYLDDLLHSYVTMDDRTFLVYEYQQVLSELAAYVALETPSLRALFIGGGGYTMPQYLEEVYPQSTLEVIEIDPAVTQVAFEYLGLSRSTKTLSYNEDARMVVPRLPLGQYDLVVGDAFNDVAIPFHLTTWEFNEQIRLLLKEEGMYAVNVVDKLHSGKFLKSFVHTLQQTFPYVYVIRENDMWDDDEQSTYVVVGSLSALASSALEQAASQSGQGQPVSHIMPRDIFESWLNSHSNILLRDDYAPVDNLLAPLYLDGR